ncbi:hypothetical protein DFH06DRAFT_1328253 [Mycena polygramma]|nr:hypothetical protein DFH06DRAFT_1343111 [Mycena polygramma]KAJ7657444.1 hypothetical protein DFH06DRAFT_1328253 [Mycena polygramma]
MERLERPHPSDKTAWGGSFPTLILHCPASLRPPIWDSTVMLRIVDSHISFVESHALTQGEGTSTPSHGDGQTDSNPPKLLQPIEHQTTESTDGRGPHGLPSQRPGFFGGLERTGESILGVSSAAQLHYVALRRLRTGGVARNKHALSGSKTPLGTIVTAATMARAFVVPTADDGEHYRCVTFSYVESSAHLFNSKYLHLLLQRSRYIDGDDQMDSQLPPEAR